MHKATPEQIKAQILAETVVQTVVNENGTLDQAAEKLPERFANSKPDKFNSKRQHVYNALQSKAAKSELRKIYDKIDTKALADRAERKLDAIISHIKPTKPTSPQMVGIQTGLKLDRRLVDQAETKTTQAIDTNNVSGLSQEQRTALLLELIRLESAGVEVQTGENELLSRQNT